MQDCCCFALAIRQRSCQNSISRCQDNIYTNITNGSTISLEFGYSITVISVNCSSITIRLSNQNFIPDLVFNIPNDSYKLFDLPQESGTLRVLVGVKQVCCSTTTSANCNN